ncbi:MAG TPA: bifunctional histidinol-phosphatase/imidazoleglycerol-phosphate dehydratase HisB [Bacteroidales bacterium]|jgi:imidazoleglycerol-phosphate dehydratase/histidinol-phosphatase|nr:bifunctional histidinol-phosphatase/imidazoleglycerol-phosphate dehydratase HisB [Bacteroidales bacterium]HOS72819.1 bifunctional histidinol-phosphatase/imidazoleglycerol-phosphate dehydratase HisB [Bacteroidales bacterium]HQH22734.1 bifunctional histidinol-phosphatase/imidazoleglycerol-phosphate dehydratase HisB [Bacteroidales bacterium]HQJ82118.1 bifunctional histidinol-phosphatase/imidazoleglycerol-phosphate dehydratase HisB [Bacteroidales bacterium]
MKKVLFIDRDGTIIVEPEDEQIDSLEKLRFLPGAISSLSAIAKTTDYELVMVTNQDGLGTSSFPEDTFWPAHNKMLQILGDEGVCFSEIFIDRTFPEENAPTRKPGTAMLTRYLARGIDPENSYVIGDRLTDLQLAENIGCGAILIRKPSGPDPASGKVFSTGDWNEIFRYLTSKPRTASFSRKTKETDISLHLNIDGSGKSSISTGIGFFDHMLDQIARHAGFDLSVRAKGDLEVDAHHLVEDTAICLGETFNNALGSKKGIARYSFVLPMDDCLAQVAADLGGRPWLVWDVQFRGSHIGEMPSEMVFHFFKSFSDSAKCNLNIKAEGTNDHHKAEAVFKAFARTLGSAAGKTGNHDLPSTKGTL